jgi:hypothetical protein
LDHLPQLLEQGHEGSQRRAGHPGRDGGEQQQLGRLVRVVHVVTREHIAALAEKVVTCVNDRVQEARSDT